MGLVGKYCYLSENDDELIYKDICFDEGIQIGEQHCPLFTLVNAEDFPGLCGSRINYDSYSTDKAKFSIGFASALSQLLACNPIHNQYLFIEDAQKTLKN